MDRRSRLDRRCCVIIREVLWLDDVVAKLEVKHRVSIDEVEQVLRGAPVVMRAQKGRVVGKDLKERRLYGRK